jgi:ribosomal protein L11 methyltransferase
MQRVWLICAPTQANATGVKGIQFHDSPVQILPSMSLIALCVTLASVHADAFGDTLLEAGAVSVSMEDALEGSPGEQPIFGEPGADLKCWDNCKITALFNPASSVEAIVRHAASTVEVDVPVFSISQVEDIDWVRASREQFQPIRISGRLHVVPTWHAETHPAPHENAIHLILDPGAAFGTGSHATTKLCLLWLEKALASNRQCTVLDYGCGSGILAIAAMKLGAVKAVGVDIDAQALDTARYNAALNRVFAEFHSSYCHLDTQADITVANILANPLIVMAPILAGRTRVEGRIALSGILAFQAEEVLQAYRPWFDIGLDSRDEDWVCLAGIRRSD